MIKKVRRGALGTLRLGKVSRKEQYRQTKKDSERAVGIENLKTKQGQQHNSRLWGNEKSDRMTYFGHLGP